MTIKYLVNGMQWKVAWGKITDGELEATKGDAQSIQGPIQQRYGEKAENVKEKISTSGSILF